jgi:hypothetical protein
VAVTEPSVVEQRAWERGVGQWCSETPCCGREIHVYDAYHQHLGMVRQAWRSPESDPDPENRFVWFWTPKDCRTCGTAWEVSFEFAEYCRLGPRGLREIVSAEPIVALWRKVDPQPPPLPFWRLGHY